MVDLYERYITGGTTLDAIYGARFFAQTFAVGNTGPNRNHTITSIKLILRRVGTPGMFTVAITATDVGGLPTGPNLVSVEYDGDTLPTFASWIEITLPYCPLIAGKTYAIVVSAPDCPGGGSILEWQRATVSGYGGGSWCYSTDSGASWGSNATRDYTFYEYGYAIARYLKKIKTKNETALTGISISE